MNTEWNVPEAPLFSGDFPERVVEMYEDDVEETFSVPAVNPKRPYGDMTYAYIDMAAALSITGEGDGNEFSDSQLEMMNELHYEMQDALQVFLLFASIVDESRIVTGLHFRRIANCNRVTFTLLPSTASLPPFELLYSLFLV